MAMKLSAALLPKSLPRMPFWTSYATQHFFCRRVSIVCCALQRIVHIALPKTFTLLR